MKGSFVIAVDQGTSSTKTVVFNEQGKIVAKGIEPLTTHYLENGFVEQEPMEIYENVLKSVNKCLEDFKDQGGDLKDIKSCGISNQRETFVLWDKAGEPLYNAVVWQCKRSTEVCDRLREKGLDQKIKERTGLLIDPYFSGSKTIWLFENDPTVKKAIVAGEAFFGTVDTWLLYKLTKGRQYLTDHTNASRTLFFNLHTLSWDQELLSDYGLTGLQLPEIQASSSEFGITDFGGLFENQLAITAMIGDSHAAAFGEGCFSPGIAKATMGTGSSILMNIGTAPRFSERGMVTTIGWSRGDHVEYALEGVIVTCGATIEWLKNNLSLFAESRETEAMANAVEDSGGVYFIPAFSGLGAPHWDMNRKASITGMTFSTNKNHIVRAALESIPYQITDVIMAMEADTGISLEGLNVDGGLTSNEFVMQLLANLLDKQVVNLGLAEVSALGAAYLSGLQSGVYPSIDYLNTLHRGTTQVTAPNKNGAKAKTQHQGWLEAIG
ncbi:FGGY family carbohydrate kinase [Salmonirosea aquatica]|uniref:glycerol kinase n=1 Tax=Salmonirosea aquatica TaxID=2654236 RepID=A0A7C9FQN0_9BACT|nr:glycerol kinase GlpK [Cytophagaceae bacterium SJW1-29]